ncbi:hypothetical protein HUJ04_010758 [Dendroctonus ponderosae]|nr:hypothetical protein HUJ04_010758 [Dendroctonus ponderosae]
MQIFLPHFTCGFLIHFMVSTSASSSEASSFVVSANYGVQSEKQKPLQTAREQIGDTTSAWHEFLPTANAWTGHPPRQTSRGLSQFGSSPLRERPYGREDIIYGSFNPATFAPHPASMESNKRIDTIPPGYKVNEILHDPNKPSVNELQELISKLIQGSTKVHQVVKVPAVYELHLQSHESPKSASWPHPEVSSWNWKQLPMTTPKQTSWEYYKAAHPIKKFNSWNPKGSRHVIKTWNLPKKLNYFEKSPEATHGEYAHPRPFWKGPRSRDPNEHVGQTSYGSVSVPITPGSTAVSFLHYQSPGKYQGQAGYPDISLYYSKKREIGQQYRRNDKQGPQGESWRHNNYLRESGRMKNFFEGLNYIVHVREKVSPSRF